MKAIKLLFLLVTLVAMSVSCRDTLGGVDPPPHITAYLCLNVVDAEGNTLTRGLDFTDEEYPGWSTLFVASDQYTLLSSPNRVDMGLYSGGAVEWAYYYIHPFLEFFQPGNLIVDYDNYLLGIGMPIPRDEPEDVITYTLTCPRLFGDDLEHQIVTYWTKVTRFPKADVMKCYRMTVDEVEYADFSYVAGEAISLTTIVLDR